MTAVGLPSVGIDLGGPQRTSAPPNQQRPALPMVTLLPRATPTG